MTILGGASLIRRTLGRTRVYLDTPLGEFFRLASNRLLLYPFLILVFLVECQAYWALRHGLDFIWDHLTFATIYSLHKALVFTLCAWVADLAAHHLLPAWGGYRSRTVGRQWLIWALGLAAGVLLLESLVNDWIIHYAPEVLAYYWANPQSVPSLGQVLLILVPYWALGVFLTLRVAQAGALATGRTGPRAATTPEQGPPADPAGLEAPLAGSLRLDQGDGPAAISLADISHITVEDHYCRVHHDTGNERRSALIRIPLKELMKALPRDHFLQTHRSHVVNLDRVSRVTRQGREHRVILRGIGGELPVSRHRLKDIAPKLKVSLQANGEP